MRWLILLMAMAGVLLAGQMRILTEEYPPQNYEYQGALKGTSTAIIRAIQARIGDSSPLTLTSWTRGYKEVLEKNNSAIFSMTRLESRESLFRWVGPISRDHAVLYEHKERPMGIQTLEDAKKVRSISSGSTANADWIHLNALGFTNLVPNDTVQQTRAIMPLLGKRADLAAGNPFITRLHLKQSGIDPGTLVNTGVVIYDKPLYLAFHKETDDSTLKSWQQALDALKASGEFEKISRAALQEAYRDFGIDAE